MPTTKSSPEILLFKQLKLLYYNPLPGRKRVLTGNRATLAKRLYAMWFVLNKNTSRFLTCHSAILPRIFTAAHTCFSNTFVFIYRNKTQKECIPHDVIHVCRLPLRHGRSRQRFSNVNVKRNLKTTVQT